MEFLTNADILINIIFYLDPETIFSLLLTNKIIRTITVNYYRMHGINFTSMPIFVSCNDIILYLQHYQSYISGTNFPEEPLWLFQKQEDSKFTYKDGKYKKWDNIRFERKQHPTHLTTYQYIPFSNNHWRTLNHQQKYIVWCSITGTHPEIKLNKDLCSPELDSLISEAYWHYPQSFARYYLNIYSIDSCDLVNAKFIAKQEIEAELKAFTGAKVSNLFNKLAEIPPDRLQEKVDSVNDQKAKEVLSNFGINGMRDIAKLFYKEGIYEIKSEDYIETELEQLRNMIEEIKEFEITKFSNLKTSNINYLFHMNENYDSGTSKLTDNVNTSCAQQ